MAQDTWDTVVIGGGAAGLSAALTLGRARRRALVLDAGAPRNRFAAHMHGVLGHDGAEPARLLAAGRAEAAGYGIEFADGTAARVDETGTGLLLTAADGTQIACRTAIAATGVTDELPGIPGLAERWGVSVLHCPYCHGWEVRDRRLGVLATSPLALHQAELVRQWSDHIVLFAAGLGTVEPAIERRLHSRGVELVSSPVTEVLGDADRVTAVRTGDGQTVPVDAIFTAGTLRPHDGFLAHLGLDRVDGPVGSFLAVDQTGKTSSDRIWAAGNITSPTANVAMAISAGAVAGAAVNMALVTAEFDAAAHAWNGRPDRAATAAAS